jgi:hypothetical protein
VNIWCGAQLESLLGALVEALDVGARCMASWRLMRALLNRRCYTHCLKMEMGRMDTLHTMWTKLLQAAAESHVVGSRRLRRMAGPGGLLTSDCAELLKSLQQLRRSCGDVLAHLRLRFPRFHFTGDEELLRTVAVAGRCPP